MKKLIRASAGCGKTYRISIEYLAILLKHKTICPSEIVVITFTKKAASEIKERIFSQLKSIFDDKSLQQSLEENIGKKLASEDFKILESYLNKLLADKHLLKVSTIDSFVMGIFNNIVAPYYKIDDYTLDQTTNDDILPEIYNEILKKENLDLYQEFFKQSALRNLESYTELVKSIIENRWFFALNENANLLPESKFSNYTKQLNLVFDLFKQHLNKTGKNLSDEKHVKKFYKDNLNKFLDLDAIKDLITDEEFILKNLDEFFDSKKCAIQFWSGTYFLKGKAFAEDKQIIDTEIKKAEQYLADYILSKKMFTEQNYLYLLANKIFNAYDEAKFKTKVFTYSDISWYTLSFLQNPEISASSGAFSVINHFYEHLLWKIRFLMIDEFQDTSVLQWRILAPIISELSSGEGAKNYGGVVIVGDEKQSIYGWRQGERELILNAKNYFSMQEFILNTSYRTKQVPMNIINHIFTKNTFFEDENNNWDYADVLTVDKQNKGYFKLNCFSYDKGTTPFDTIAYEIKTAIDKGKLKLGNCAILARKISDLLNIEKSLKHLGFTCYLDTSDSIINNKYIYPIISLIKYKTMNCRYSLIEFLRSDYILAYPKNIEEYMQIESDTELDEKLKSDFKQLNAFDSIYTPLKFLQVFIKQFILKNIAEFSIVLQMYDICRQFELSNQNLSSLHSFLRFCEKYKNDELFKIKSTQKQNSITLLTIHKSKGLEFDTVFVLHHISKGANDNKPYYYYNFDDSYMQINQGFVTYNYNSVVKKSQLSHFAEKQKTKQEIEDLNVLYVALTRAKSNFLYYCFRQQIKSSKTDSINKRIFSYFDDITNENGIYEQGELLGTESEQKTELFAVPKNKYWLEQAIVKQVEDDEISNPKARLLGTVAHFYLENIVFDEPKARQKAQQHVIHEFGTMLSQLELNELFAKVNTFLDKNSYYFKKSNWQKAYNEFSIFENNQEYRIDRLLVNNKTIIILDYKIGQIVDSEQLNKYKKIISQLNIVKQNKLKIETKYLKIDL